MSDPEKAAEAKDAPAGAASAPNALEKDVEDALTKSRQAGASWRRSILISFGIFILLIVALVVFIMLLAPDLLPFDYGGFD
jgi:hypothetical protein